MESYSALDLYLLDNFLDSYCGKRIASDYDIFILDVVFVKKGLEIEKIFPGVTKIFQTPIVGIWENSSLKEMKWGYEGRRILEHVLNIKIEKG